MTDRSFQPVEPRCGSRKTALAAASAASRIGNAIAMIVTRAYPDLAVGLHFDLGEWSFEGREWRAVYTIADADDDKAVRAEVDVQLVAFRKLIGRDPTHIDSHQHVHWTQPCRRLLEDAARMLGIPLRDRQHRLSW